MTLCRVCAIPGDDSAMFRLFDDAEEPLALAEIFLQVSGIAIQVGDSNLPKCCCQRCRNRLQEVEDLRALCQESDRKLRKMIGITVKEEEESEEHNGNDGRAIPKVEMLELDESYSHWDDMGNKLDSDDGRSEYDDDKPYESMQNKRDDANIAMIGVPENGEKYYFSGDSKDGDPDFTAEKTLQNMERKKKEEPKKRGRKPKIRDPNADPKEEKERKKASESLCCIACGKVYKSLFALREHETTHTLEKRFKCEICAMEFGKRTIFILHVKRHETEGKFKCSECEKAFHTEKLLNQHIQIRHRGERPFHCKLCPKTYPRASSLYVHVQTFHEKIRKKIYKCDICTRSFVNRHGYERHMNSHQGLKLNQCPHCGNKYEFRAYLLQHIAEKHPETVPNLTRCEYCGLGYSTDGYYRKHIVKRHPEHLAVFDQLMKAKREAILAGMPPTTVTFQETGGSFS
ncbi:hypothetical protein quinque_008310 [Culex quinquefasciatus]